MKRKRAEQAVSDIIATILLLGITVALFSVVSLVVLSYPFNPSAPHIDILAWVEEVDGESNIVLEHRGGEPLGLDAQILMTIGGETLLINNKTPTVADFLSEEAKEDNMWGIGEIVNYSDKSITGKQIAVTVVDSKSNSIILTATLQEGFIVTPVLLSTSVNTISPYEQTSSPLTITANGDSRLDNITLNYRYSTDNSSWSNYQVFNRDVFHPWEWSFNFPDGTGYYEFYSIGRYAGGVEDTPTDADAKCSYFHYPTINNPYPANGALDVPLSPTLHIDISDDDGDDMDIIWFSNVSGSWQSFGNNYSVYNGTYYMTNSNFNEFETTYYWSVSVDDGTRVVYSPTYKFTTKAQNKPPYIPNSPNPSNDSIDIELNTDLSWSGGDPDGDSVTYDVYFDTTNPPITKAISNQSSTTYDPGMMDVNETYYWQIIAWDDKGNSSIGPIWKFTTKEQQIITITFSPSEDSFICSGYPNKKYGTLEYLRVGFSYTRRSLIYFDLSSLSQKTIISAELKLYKYDNKYSCDYSNPVSRTYDVHHITDTWTEKDVKWNNRPDYDVTVTDNDVVVDAGWMEWNVTTDVQAFANGTFTNYGWLIKDNSEGYCYSCSYFRSREYSDVNYRPVLEVVYVD